MPETIWISLENQSDEIPQINKNKICALQLLLTTNRPWVEFEVFEKVSQSIANKKMNPFILEPLEAEDAFIGMAVLQFLRPDEIFSKETLIYVTACFRNQGLIALGNSKFISPLASTFHESLSQKNKEISKNIEAIFPKFLKKYSPSFQFDENNIVHVQLKKLCRIYFIVNEFLKNYVVIL